MKIVTVTNQKGGVGKTTLACHLVWYAAETGNVLALDLDTQANLTQTLAGRTRGLTRQASDLFLSDTVDPEAVSEGISLLSGGPELKEIDEEVTLTQAIGLGERLRSLPFDVAVIDTPPAIGVRQVAPFFWTDELVVVVDPSIFSLKGLSDILEMVEKVRSRNPKLVLSVVVNRHRQDSPGEGAILEKIRALAGDSFVNPVLRDSLSVSSGLLERVPVWRYPFRKGSHGEEWREVLRWILGSKNP